MRHVFVLISLEIILAFISTPLYLGIKSASVSAYFREKGGYEKINFDYNIRRVLTLTGVGIFLLIWLFKLAIIIFVPQAYGPLPLYRVGNLEPIDMVVSGDLAATSVAFQTAKTLSSLPSPQLKEIRKVAGGTYVFIGNSQPSMEVVLLLSEKNTIVYSGAADKNGRWEIKHSQKDIRLSEGNHSVLVYNFDAKSGVRSVAAGEKFFKITNTWIDSLVKDVDVSANWSVVLIVIVGILLTFLTL